MVTFNDVLKQICVLFSKNIGETVVSSQVGFESIKLAREEIDYK